MKKLLVFVSATELIRVPSETVVYIAAKGNYSVMTLIDGSTILHALQLGQIERSIAEVLGDDDNRFIRVGKSLIVNRDFIVFVNPLRKKIVLSDCRSFRYPISASKEALRALKLEMENSL